MPQVIEQSLFMFLCVKYAGVNGDGLTTKEFICRPDSLAWEAASADLAGAWPGCDCPEQTGGTTTEQAVCFPQSLE